MTNLVYSQKSGRLFENARIVGKGYSGAREGVNNPLLEHEIGLGPIPCGLWSIGKPYRHAKLGRFAIPLTALQTSQPQRSGFFIHGDNEAGNRSASNGCIVLPSDVRGYIVHAGATTLTVVPL